MSQHTTCAQRPDIVTTVEQFILVESDQEATVNVVSNKHQHVFVLVMSSHQTKSCIHCGNERRQTLVNRPAAETLQCSRHCHFLDVFINPGVKRQETKQIASVAGTRAAVASSSWRS